MHEPAFWIRFVVAILATWRVTHLLALEDGPWDLVVRLRLRLGSGFVGSLMDCFKCLSLWIAAPAALFVARRPLDWLFVWLALSGAACLLERVGQEPALTQADAQPLEGELDHVLRSEAIGAQDDPGAINGAGDGHEKRD